jgi:hypothetical protein
VTIQTDDDRSPPSQSEGNPPPGVPSPLAKEPPSPAEERPIAWLERFLIREQMTNRISKRGPSQPPKDNVEEPEPSFRALGSGDLPRGGMALIVASSGLKESTVRTWRRILFLSSPFDQNPSSRAFQFISSSHLLLPFGWKTHSPSISSPMEI